MLLLYLCVAFFCTFIHLFVCLFVLLYNLLSQTNILEVAQLHHQSTHVHHITAAKMFLVFPPIFSGFSLGNVSSCLESYITPSGFGVRLSSPDSVLMQLIVDEVILKHSCRVWGLYHTCVQGLMSLQVVNLKYVFLFYLTDFF